MMKNVAVTHYEIHLDAKFLKYAFLFSYLFFCNDSLGADLTKKIFYFNLTTVIFLNILIYNCSFLLRLYSHILFFFFLLFSESRLTHGRGRELKCPVECTEVHLLCT